MPETTPLIKAALNLRGGAGFDVYDHLQNIMTWKMLKIEKVNKIFLGEGEEKSEVMGSNPIIPISLNP